MKTIDLVIPVFNEEQNINFVVNEIADDSVYELLTKVIIVNDGSRDNTLNFLKDLKKRYKKINIINHQHKIGQSAAFYSGIKFSNSKIIVTMDGDGQIISRDIKKIIDFFDQVDVDLVSGIRINRIDTTLKKISSKLAFFIRRIFLKDNAIDTGCSLKIFYREKFLTLPYFDNMHRFIPILFKRENFSIKYFNISHRKRYSGKSKYGFFDRLIAGLFDLLGVMWLLRRKKITRIDINNNE